MPEWSNGVLSKSIERAIVPGVRIPPLPPYFSINGLRLQWVKVTLESYTKFTEVFHLASAFNPSLVFHFVVPTSRLPSGLCTELWPA